MKNLIQYTYGISLLFHNFLHGKISKDELIDGINKIEQYHRDSIKDTNPEKSFWFKFSDTDTLATTTNDLEKYLSDTRSKTLIIEMMKEAINLNGELLVYYS